MTKTPGLAGELISKGPAPDPAALPGEAVEVPETIIEPRRGWQRLGLKHLWAHRDLLWYLVMRNIRGRYRPHALGMGWILLRPLLFSLVYIVIFGMLLQVKSGPIPYPIFVVSGILLYLFFSGAASETASSLASQARLISKVYYPRLIVPMTSLLSNLLDLAATLGLVILFMAVYQIHPTWNVLMAPVFLLAFVAVTLAVGLNLAVASVKSRDWIMVIPVLMRVAVYLMPVAYPATLVPEKYRDFYFLNPTAVYLQGFRWSLLGDTAPPLWPLLVATGGVLVALFVGLVGFSRVERTMADVL